MDEDNICPHNPDVGTCPWPELDCPYCEHYRWKKEESNGRIEEVNNKEAEENGKKGEEHREINELEEAARKGTLSDLSTEPQQGAEPE